MNINTQNAHAASQRQEFDLKYFRERSAALEQQLAESQSKLEKMAAENAGLKESRKNLAEFIHEEINADYPLNMDIETPATDAFLAEVRAQGVEMAAKSEQFSTWVQQGLRSFAIGVRQGGAV